MNLHLQPGETNARNATQDIMVDHFVACGGVGEYRQRRRGEGATVGIMCITINSVLQTGRDTMFLTDLSYRDTMYQMMRTALYHFDCRVKMDFLKREIIIEGNRIEVVEMPKACDYRGQFHGIRRRQDVFGEVSSYVHSFSGEALNYLAQRMGSGNIGCNYMLIRQ